MANKGKRWRESRGKVHPTTRYSLEDAIKLVKETTGAEFDESVDIAVRLGVNPRQADQMVRGAVSLPHGVGKSVRVVVFADGEAAKWAEDAGADFVGGDELVKKVQEEGWVDFDKAVAIRSMMSKVGRLGRILGPRGLMPNPKTGTVVAPEQVASVVQELKAGRIDFKVERAGIVHTAVGKASFSEEALRDNVLALVGTLLRLKPASAKGLYVRGIALSNTMGPGIRLESNEVVRAAAEIR
ncbi:MAG: 50S ribosomal protein L1 [Deltaproteobacteria bacterium]|nr:50S ribosomal protein L1 [Deltaproteobacteria bacterium]